MKKFFTVMAVLIFSLGAHSQTTLTLIPHVCVNLTSNCVTPTNQPGVYVWANADFAVVLSNTLDIECNNVTAYSVVWNGDNFTVYEACENINISEEGYRFRTHTGSGRGGGYPGTRYQITGGSASY